MELETGIIKGKKTSYTKTDGNKVVKYSKTINLGVNSCFDCGTNVVVMAETDYNKLMDINSNEIKLSETLKELSNNNDELMELVGIANNKVDSLTADNIKLRDRLQQATNNNADKSDKIVNLTETMAEVEQQLTEYLTILKQYNITSADELNTIFGEFRIILNYLNDCIIAYETQGRINRFLKKNPTTNIVKPPTKLIDYKGNQYINNGADISTNKVDGSKE